MTTVYVVGESWCPFTQSAWNISTDSDSTIQIEKIDCGTCPRLASESTADNAELCRNACDMSRGYPSFIVEDGNKLQSCGYGFDNERAAMQRIRNCIQ